MRRTVTALALSALLWSCSSDKGTNDPPQQAPVAPNTPSPAHLATNQDVSVNLTWQCSDPQGDSLGYDIYFGTSTPPPLVSSTYGINSYSTGQLANATTYYWKVAARDSDGNLVTGAVWSFTTLGNRPPNMPTTPSPEHLLQGKEYSGIIFSWECSDPDGDSLTYDLYIGTSTALQKVKSSLPDPEYVANGLDWFYTLDFNHTYYWQVVASDGKGLSTAGPVWSFMTHKEARLIANLRNIGSITDIALNGNQVILVDYGTRLLSVDISNPAAPVGLDALNLDVSSVDVYGGCAYASTPGWLDVINISNPADIRVASSHRLTGQTSGGAVRVVGSKVFASCGNYIDVFNILSPSSLVLSGTLSGSRAVYGDFAVAGNIIYVGAWGSVLDITNLSSPTTVITPIPWLHVLRQDYEMHSSGGSLYSAWGYLYALDVSNPRTPLITDSTAFPLKITLSAHTCVYSRNGLVYVATRQSVGPLIVYDASDPANLKLYAWYSRVATWGEAVVANDTHIFVAASGEGLLVLEIQ